MKKKFKLEKKKRGYAICNINNPVVKVVMHILAGKVMQKCRPDEVPALVVAHAAQCVEGFSSNGQTTYAESSLRIVARHRSRGRLITMPGFYCP